MTTPLANPRRTKLDSWPEPREEAKESDQSGGADAGVTSSSSAFAAPGSMMDVAVEGDRLR